MADPKKARRGSKGLSAVGIAMREKIRTGTIVDRLNKNALGELKDPRTGEPYMMQPSELDSARMLLDRVMPKLTSQALTGADGEGPAVVVLMKDGKGK